MHNSALRDSISFPISCSICLVLCLVLCLGRRAACASPLAPAFRVMFLTVHLHTRYITVYYAYNYYVQILPTAN
jgi:hypothetical protein